MTRLLGPQWPPYTLVPASFTAASARELADFAVMIGQPGDEWQRNVLDIGCGEHQDGTWTAQEVALLCQRQNGKGWFPETRGLGGLFLLGERLLIYTAHLIDTAKMTFGRCVELVDGYDDLRRRVKRVNKVNGEEAIEHVSGAEMQFRTRGRGAGKGRGFTADTLFLDEALYVRQETLDALLPTMLARPNPQIWYLSTPPETPDAALMRIRDDGLAGVPNMAMAMWRNPRDADLDDEAALAFANPAWGIRLNRAVMGTLRRRLGEVGFARECGGIWPERGADMRWLLIPEAMWTAAKVDHLRPSSRMRDPVAYGVAVAPDRSWSAIAAAGRMAGGGRLVEVTGDGERQDYRPGTGWLVARLAELDRHRPCVMVIDDKAMCDQAEAAGLVVVRAQPADQAAAAAILFDGVAGEDPAGRDVHHLDQAHMTVAAAGVRRRRTGTAWVLESAGTVDVSTVRAGSLALWGLATPRVHRKQRAASVAVVNGASARPADAAPVSVEEARLREQIERDLRSVG